jgi:hypothetical protein
MLIFPAFLYSIAPEEPLKEGVTVFSDGKQRVYLADPQQYREAGYGTYCILEPQEQLTVLQRPSDRSDGMLSARFEGKHTVQFPFCPPHAMILAKSHQVTQKERLLQSIIHTATRVFNR